MTGVFRIRSPLNGSCSIGYKKNIVVLTRKEGYRKKKTSLMGAIRLSLKKYPHLCEAMEMRHEMYNRQLDYVGEQKKAGNTLVLAPSPYAGGKADGARSGKAARAVRPRKKRRRSAAR